MRRVDAKPVKISEKRTRYTFQVLDEPTEPESLEMWTRQIGFLRDLADNPALLTAGHARCTSFIVRHDGTQWVLFGEVESDSL